MAAKTKKKYGEAERRAMLNARNRRAKAKARTVTGPLVWCDPVAHYSGNVKACGRCGARPQYYEKGKRKTQ